MADGDDDELMTPYEVSVKLRCTVPTVGRYRKRGQLPRFKKVNSRRYLYDPRDVRELLNSGDASESAG